MAFVDDMEWGVGETIDPKALRKTWQERKAARAEKYHAKHTLPTGIMEAMYNRSGSLPPKRIQINWTAKTVRWVNHHFGSQLSMTGWHTWKQRWLDGRIVPIIQVDEGL